MVGEDDPPPQDTETTRESAARTDVTMRRITGVLERVGIDPPDIVGYLFAGPCDHSTAGHSSMMAERVVGRGVSNRRTYIIASVR